MAYLGADHYRKRFGSVYPPLFNRRYWSGTCCRVFWVGANYSRSLASYWCHSQSGEFFTVQVAIKEDHQLKTDGYYTNVRHPSHTASLLSFIGFGGIVLVDRDPDVVTTNLMK